MIIYWATRLRGFLRHVSEHTPGVRFVDNGRYYEVSGWKAKIKSNLIRSRLLDPVGLFQIIRVEGKECDFYGSFNRFLHADKPYFIYLENPTALYHYALGRVGTRAGRKRFQKCLDDPNLKYIVCMSEACRSTFETINMPLPDHVKMKAIYPLVPQNHRIDTDGIRQKCHAEVLECLYCVQGKSFYTKGGKDILDVITKLQDAGLKIHLTVITNVDALQPETLTLLQSRQDITLHDFTFSYEEMEQIYARTALLLQPSSADSFGLAVLEAMKGGSAILGSKLYAFPEIVEDNGNGCLMDPKYWTFLPNNMPNPAAWGYKNKHRLMKQDAPQYISDMERLIRMLYEDREKLCSFALRSKELADSKFGEEAICAQWQDVWNTLKGTETV